MAFLHRSTALCTVHYNNNNNNITCQTILLSISTFLVQNMTKAYFTLHENSQSIFHNYTLESLWVLFLSDCLSVTYWFYFIFLSTLCIINQFCSIFGYRILNPYIKNDEVKNVENRKEKEDFESVKSSTWKIFVNIKRLRNSTEKFVTAEKANEDALRKIWSVRRISIWRLRWRLYMILVFIIDKYTIRGCFLYYHNCC